MDSQVVRNQEEASGEDEESGPLAEIDFWRRRSRNLSGIHAQIQQPVLLSFWNPPVMLPQLSSLCYKLFAL